MKKIFENIRLITAPNPSPMTQKGTNTYILGNQEGLCIIDPGPDNEQHYEQIKNIINKEKASHILVTHSHLDHSPLATRMSRDFSIPIFAHGKLEMARSSIMKKLLNSNLEIGGFEGLDTNFRPDYYLNDLQVINGFNWSIEVVHTPGHLADHLCFSVIEKNILFSGDIVMGWTSTLISPPDGDVGQYFNSLDKLLNRSDNVYLPGHGLQVENAKAYVAKLKKHRMERENQILSILKIRPLNSYQIANKIYKNQPQPIIYAGSRNVFAHLINLLERNLICCDGAISPDNCFEFINK